MHRCKKGHLLEASYQGIEAPRPVAENGFMGMGIGAAMTGLRPIIEGMNMGFLLLAYNQISNNAGMLHYTSGGQYKAIFLPSPPLDLFECHSCSLGMLQATFSVFSCGSQNESQGVPMLCK